VCDTPPLVINANDSRRGARLLMHPIDPTLVAALTGLVSQAGEAIRAIARKPLAVRRKADLSPVTAADEAAQAVILEGLAKLLPGVPVVSEELAGSEPAIDAGAPFILVDPLDGTKEFIARRDEYTVNLALIEAGEPSLGFVFLPARVLLYRGRVGQFAERLSLEAGMPPEAARDAARDAAQIRVRPAPSRLVAAVSRSHLDPATEAFLSRLPVAGRVASGSSLKFGLLAEGAADVYPRLAPTHEWDIAAGHAVLAAAGGTVVRPDGAALTYGHADTGFLVPAFVAWGDPQCGNRPAARERRGQSTAF
jgi:3'(2'), 5'-bisphosphate nucleotidase